MAAHLLLVEDEPMIGRILEHKLVREGHRVTWVRDCSAAVVVLAVGDVDLALVDVPLERDGGEFMASVVAPRAGWVAMVGQRDAASVARARAAGAADVVLKPFKPTAVAALVASLLEHAPV